MVEPVDDGRDPRRAAHVLVQVERGRLAPAAAQQLGVASPTRSRWPRRAARRPRPSAATGSCPCAGGMPGAARAASRTRSGSGPAPRRRRGGRTPPPIPLRQALAGEQARGGRGGRQLGEHLHAGALGHLLPQPQERLRRPGADSLLVAPLPAVRIRAQRPPASRRRRCRPRRRRLCRATARGLRRTRRPRGLSTGGVRGRRPARSQGRVSSGFRPAESGARPRR